MFPRLLRPQFSLVAKFLPPSSAPLPANSMSLFQPSDPEYSLASSSGIWSPKSEVFCTMHAIFIDPLNGLTRTIPPTINIDPLIHSAQCQNVPFSLANSLGGLMTSHRQNEVSEQIPRKEYGPRDIAFTPVKPLGVSMTRDQQNGNKRRLIC